MIADDAIEEMTEDACWAALERAPLARIAVCAAGEVDVSPINVVVDDGSVLFRTAPGSKLLGLVAHPGVAVEVDGYDDTSAWSVVLKGEAERVELQSEIDVAEQLPLHPWIPTLKYRWVRVRATRVTGRRFVRGPEPDRF